VLLDGQFGNDEDPGHRAARSARRHQRERAAICVMLVLPRNRLPRSHGRMRGPRAAGGPA
jgi:hypothetical protein